MTNTVKAVKTPEADPKAGKPRASSGVRFPYVDLDRSIEVAKAIHEKAGGLCDNAQLATLLGYSGINNGSFRMLMSAARMFGLIEDTEDRKIRVSARGRVIVAPITPTDERRARVEAFLNVELFKRIYDQFHGTTLPENIGLRNLLENEYKVIPERIAPTVRILMDSADQAGMFEAAGNRTKMVMPLSLGRPASPPATPPAPRSNEHQDSARNGGGGGSGGSGGGNGNGGMDRIDPAIVGLLQRLPPGGSPMPAKRRKALIDAFTNVIEFIYPDADEVE